MVNILDAGCFVGNIFVEKRHGGRIQEDIKDVYVKQLAFES